MFYVSSANGDGAVAPAIVCDPFKLFFTRLSTAIDRNERAEMLEQAHRGVWAALPLSLSLSLLVRTMCDRIEIRSNEYRKINLVIGIPAPHLPRSNVEVTAFRK